MELSSQEVLVIFLGNIIIFTHSNTNFSISNLLELALLNLFLFICFNLLNIQLIYQMLINMNLGSITNIIFF